MFKKLAISAVIAIAPAVGAQAAQLTATELLQQFNVITTGDVVNKGGLHIHGRALIGGTLSGDMAEVNNDGVDGIIASDYDELIIGNATSDTKARVLGGGSASFNGTPTQMDMNGGGVSSSPAVMPDNYAAILDAFSTDLKKLATNATVDTTTFTNVAIFDEASTGGTSVYNISQSDLDGRNIDLLLNGADNIVINVIGSGDFDLTQGFRGSKDVSKDVIWNFVGFDELYFGVSMWGTILASGAEVTYHNDVEGTLYADSVIAHGQMHIQPTTYVPPVSEVPLPASMVLLMGGFAGLGALRLRRRA
ncbi:collagen-binding domain-containing protein [Heliomarina baculiformis]|uniref:collagen-binding domain-containing protein n=1 Tax=Heliomarina baculiformis TaxID=2872036 RepID=UPI001EE35369|nr:collagen-binding domain-containing protein [Heliomarina baculiformis]